MRMDESNSPISFDKDYFLEGVNSFVSMKAESF